MEGPASGATYLAQGSTKKDEIRDTFVHGVESVASHQQLMWLVVGVALVVALAIFGWSSYTRRQTAKASASLDDAMKIYQSRIRHRRRTSRARRDHVRIDEKNKFTDAEQKFLDVANQVRSRTRPGQIARYYAALSEAQIKKFAEAEKNLQQLDSSADENLGSLARFQLAAVYDQDNKGGQAVDLYKKLADKPSVFVPQAAGSADLGGPLQQVRSRASD